MVENNMCSIVFVWLLYTVVGCLGFTKDTDRFMNVAADGQKIPVSVCVPVLYVTDDAPSRSFGWKKSRKNSPSPHVPWVQGRKSRSLY